MAVSKISELLERGLIWGAEEDNDSISEYFIKKASPNNCSVINNLQDIALPNTTTAVSQKNLYLEQQPLRSIGLGSIGIELIDRSLPGGGWKKGVIHEFFYSERKFASAPITIPSILASQSCKQIFWVGRKSWPTPFLLERLHFPKLENQKNYKDCCFFIDPKDRKEALWSIETILRGSSDCSVIADCSLLNFSLSRRLALAAENSKSLLILLREQKYASSPGSATTRWKISQLPTSNQLPAWQLELLQCRGKEPSQKIWKIEEKLTDVVNQKNSEKVDINYGETIYGEALSLHLSAEMEAILKGDTKQQQSSIKQSTRAA